MRTHEILTEAKIGKREKLRPTPDDIKKIRQFRHEVRCDERNGGQCGFTTKTAGVNETVLNELFRDPKRMLHTEWSWGGKVVTAAFSTPKGTPLIVSFDKDKNEYGTWSISLEVAHAGEPTKFKETGAEEPQDGWIIYSTVVECVLKFLTREEPDRFVLSGYTDRQHKLYGMMIKNIAPRLKNLGYEVEHGKGYDYVSEFVITKIVKLPNHA